MKITKFIIAIVSTLILTACSNKDEQLTNEELQESSLKSIELIVENTEGFIYEGDDPNIQNKFSNLSSDELTTYFELLAEKIAVEIKEDDLHSEFSLEEMQDYYFNLLKSTNKVSINQFSKELNNVSSDDFFFLIDRFTEEITEIIIDNMSSEFQQKREKFINEDSVSFKNNDLSKKFGCSEYQFSIKTYVANTSKYDCTGYSQATYPNNTDCDFEFHFDWDLYYTPNYSIGLMSDSNGVKKVLDKGGIQGRVNVDDNTIRFLIGKGRIYLTAFMSPNNFSKNLKANW